VICPTCRGEKVGWGLVDYEDGTGGPAPIECPGCKGSGSVAAWSPEWRKAGAAMRSWRESLPRSIGQEARRRGISVVTLSDMELGYIEPVLPVEFGGAA
jgi:hypothetical protein